jgi:pimeloyl-ACP methyl ester carboxylesterase
MRQHDDDLTRFAAQGAPALPAAVRQGQVEHDGARIWHATYGDGRPVVLLHGGLGHSGNWGNQVPTLVAAGHRVIAVDSRGHGRSTRDDRPFSYDVMASDVAAVLDEVGVERAPIIGWSDGACTAMVLARKAPSRVAGVFFFGCNMDPSGAKEFHPTPVVDRCFARHAEDYATLSATPDEFTDFVGAVSLMQRTQPDYTAADLAEIRVPVTIAHSTDDEFITREHAEYLARTIPDAELVILEGVSHFAPLQRPEVFDTQMLAVLHTRASSGLDTRGVG